MKRIIACFLVVMLLAGCTVEPSPAEEPEKELEQTAETPMTGPETPEQPEQPEEEQPDNRYRFTRENFPVLDGSTSMLPLGEAVAASLLGEPQTEAAEKLEFHRTTESFRYLMRGESDLLLVAEPNAAVFEEMKQAGFSWQMEPIAKEALVFIVNSRNPVESLTVEQLQGIYTGQITNWSQLGGDNVEIVAFQRNPSSGSQVLMNKLVMDGLEWMEAPEEWVPGEMDSLMRGVKGYEDTASAIGYSVYYYANDMRMAEGMKILKIEGVEPTDETIGDESYPLINPYFAVISADAAADSPTRLLFDWLLGADGQAVLESQGYVSVNRTALGPAVWMDASGLTKFAAPEEIFTRRTPEPVEELTPGDYGMLRPYVGSRVADMNIYGEEASINGSMGLLDASGAIVVDPVYTEVWAIPGLQMYRLAKSEMAQHGETAYAVKRYGFCTIDGSVSVPCQYTNLTETNGYLLAVLDPMKGLFHVYDGRGRLLLDSASWEERPVLQPWNDVPSGYVSQEVLALHVEGGGKWNLYDWSGTCLGEDFFWVDVGTEAPYIVYDDQVMPHYVDARGEPVLDMDYASADLFHNGQALVSRNGSFTVIDQSGQELWTAPPETVTRYLLEDKVLYGCYNRDGRTRWFDGEFRELFADYDTVKMLEDGWFLCTKEDTVWLTDGTKITEVPSAKTGDGYGWQRGDLILLYIWHMDGTDFWVFRSDLTPVCQTTFEDPSLNILQDPFGGDSIVVKYDSGSYPYRNRPVSYDGAPQLPGVYVLGIYGGWYQVEDTFSSGYMDAEGNWLFRVSLMADMTD